MSKRTERYVRRATEALAVLRQKVRVVSENQILRRISLLVLLRLLLGDDGAVYFFVSCKSAGRGKSTGRKKSAERRRYKKPRSKK
ncbi:MAG: hypothetical protein MPK11_08830 [Gammaproteobacteria bacterium]|nr:hypothetical protein [Gammaproteobacteria bacterium]MDA7961959.1 hypothetical protein [Gammaproteobacteria bacterium]MDA7970855.1 hypothetical protein [Gammaproteobacteria bacterium]MDA8024223.1 hypothetical protein [Gammaproteobacteria bacterium]MDA8030911.1 hypothetical protein [Alphaproteobacteria bacterium]